MEKNIISFFILFIICVVIVDACLCGPDDFNPNECKADCGDNPDFSQSTSGAEVATYCNQNTCTSEQINNIPDANKAEFFEQLDNYNSLSTEDMIKNSKYIDLSNQKAIDKYNSMSAEEQKKIQEHFNDFEPHPKDKKFFENLITPENKKNFWKNYHLGDITKFMKGLSFSEKIAAIKAYIGGGDNFPAGSEVSSDVFSQALNEEYGTNVNLNYDANADIQVKDGNLIINGNTIELDSLKSETHTIEVSPDGKVYLDGELLVQDSSITIDSSGPNDIFNLDQGSFTTGDLEANTITNFKVKLDGTGTGEYAQVVKITPNSPDVDLKGLEVTNAKGITITDEYYKFDSASQITVTRIVDGKKYLSKITNAKDITVFKDGSYIIGTADVIYDDFNDIEIKNFINADIGRNVFVDEAQFFSTGNIEITEAKNIEFLPDGVKFEYDAKRNIVDSYDLNYTIKFDDASSVKIDKVWLRDIIDTELFVEDDFITRANITSKKDNNEFQVGDFWVSGLDVNETIVWDSRTLPFRVKLYGEIKAGFVSLGYFIAYEPYGEFEYFERPNYAEYNTFSGLLVINKVSLIYQDMISCIATCYANISYKTGVGCMNLSTGAYYQFNKTPETYKIDVNEDDYKLCIRKKPNQVFTTYDGYADNVDKKYDFLGKIYYSRLLSMLRPVYKSYSTAHTTISDSVFVNGTDTITNYGYFSIIEESVARFATINNTMIAPKTFYSYKSENSPYNITFTDHLIQKGPNGSEIDIYEPGSDAEKKRIAELMEYRSQFEG